jgi:methyl-accepting chemotaxis protein
MIQRLTKPYIPSIFEAGSEELRRAEIIATVALLGCITSWFIAASYFSYKHYLSVGVLIVASFLYYGAMVLLRITKNTALTTHVLCTMGFLKFNALIITSGGLQSSVLQWLSAVPMVAALILGRTYMLRWMVITLVVVAVYFGMSLMGYVFINKVPPQNFIRSEFVGFVSLCLVSAAIGYTFESNRKTALETVVEANAATSSMNTHLSAMTKDLQVQKARVEASMRESEEMRAYLSSSVEEMLRGVQDFASGNLSVRLTVRQDDEIGRLYQGFNAALETMCGVISHVANAASTTVGASEQISERTQYLSRGVQEQSAEVANVVQMSEQLAAQMSNYAASASEFAKRSEEDIADSSSTKTSMHEMIAGMERIQRVVSSSSESIEELGKRSDVIGEIIQTIEEIADQTNLLALNAAIEAARAGEQGRGFAVVADEVRKLAERTQKATKEISSVIREIQSNTTVAVETMRSGTQEVERGKQLVSVTSAALERYMERVHKSISAYTNLANDGHARAQDTSHLAGSVERINTVTQDSALYATQIAHAASDMNRIAEELLRAVQRFHVG